MADIDFESLTTPISDEAPCGSDLDEEFDMDFMNFVAELEGNLPTSFFKFEPADFPFDTSFEQIAALTERTRDLRLLVPLAKLYALRGNLEGMAKTLDGVHRLLAEHFHDLHPRPMDGDYGLRNGYLFTIDDMPNAVLPFQHAPLVRSRRHGAITVRKFQVANGDVNAREDEDRLDLSAIHTAMAEADASEIDALRENLALLKSALSGIANVTIAEAGFEDAVRLEKLPAAIDVALEIVALAGGDSTEAGTVDDASAAGGPVAEGGVQTVRVPTGAVANREAAVAAMFAAEKYFATSEPSSPAPLLLRYAQALAVKSFNELVTDLIPDFASSAMVSLGRDPYFQVQLSAIEANHPAPDYDGSGEAGEAASDGWSSWEAAGLDDEEVSEDAETVEASDGQTDDDAGGEAPDELADAAEEPEAVAPPDPEPDPEPEPEPEPDPEPDAAPAFEASNRPEALALLQQVQGYYRLAEPTSPVPLIVERVVEMSSKSFIDLLSDVLPDGSLKVIPKPGEEGNNSGW